MINASNLTVKNEMIKKNMRHQQILLFDLKKDVQSSQKFSNVRLENTEITNPKVCRTL